MLPSLSPNAYPLPQRLCVRPGSHSPSPIFLHLFAPTHYFLISLFPWNFKMFQMANSLTSFATLIPQFFFPFSRYYLSLNSTSWKIFLRDSFFNYLLFLKNLSPMFRPVILERGTFLFYFITDLILVWTLKRWKWFYTCFTIMRTVREGPSILLLWNNFIDKSSLWDKPTLACFLQNIKWVFLKQVNTIGRASFVFGYDYEPLYLYSISLVKLSNHQHKHLISSHKGEASHVAYFHRCDNCLPPRETLKISQNGLTF